MIASQELINEKMKQMKDTFLALKEFEHPTMASLVGSQRITYWNADETSDVDILVYTTFLPNLEDYIKALGFEESEMGDYGGGTWFLSYRNGWINLLVTNSMSFFARFCGATEIAVRDISAGNNLFLIKEERIKFFQEVLYSPNFPTITNKPINKHLIEPIPLVSSPPKSDKGFL